jgi:hypothetical protein
MIASLFIPKKIFLKYLLIRKKIEMAQVNKDLQVTIYSWFRRKQTKLIVYRIPSWRKNTGTTEKLGIPIRSEALLSRLFEMFSNLKSFGVEDDELVRDVINTFSKMPDLVSTLNEMSISAAIKSTSKITQICSFLDQKPKLTNVKLDITEQYLDGKEKMLWNKVLENAYTLQIITFSCDMDFWPERFNIEREILNLSNVAADTLKFINISFLKDLNASQLKLFLTKFPHLTKLNVELTEKDIFGSEGIGRIESWCDAFNSSLCDDLKEINISVRLLMDDESPVSHSDAFQDNMLPMLRAIGTRWPYLKIFALEATHLRRENPYVPLSAAYLREVLELFKNSEKLTLQSFDFLRDPEVEAHFPITTIKDLSISKLKNWTHLLSILISFPSLHKLRILEIGKTVDKSKSKLDRKSFESLSLELSIGLLPYEWSSRRVLDDLKKFFNSFQI